MNTLKYKVLLIKTSCIVFARAIGIYLLITLPALVFPPMYIMSAGFALGFGWLAGLLFTLFLYFLQKAAINRKSKTILLYTSIVISVLVAFEAIEVMKAWDDVWASGPFLLFPFAAIASGCISTTISGNSINTLLQHDQVSQYENNDIISPVNPNNS